MLADLKRQVEELDILSREYNSRTLHNAKALNMTETEYKDFCRKLSDQLEKSEDEYYTTKPGLSFEESARIQAEVKATPVAEIVKKYL